MANAYAESWVRSVVEECLVLILMIHTAHLQRVWLVYITYDYHVSGPPQGIEQLTPITWEGPIDTNLVGRRKVLGGIINECKRPSRCFLRAAAWRSHLVQLEAMFFFLLLHLYEREIYISDCTNYLCPTREMTTLL